MNSDTVNTEKGSSSSSSSSSSNGDGLSNELSSMAIDSSSSSSKKKKNTCLHCLEEVQGSSRCSRCETALYCSRECQVKHWPVHKNSCRNSNDTDDSNEKLEMKAKNHYDQGNSNYIYMIGLSLLI